MKVVVLGATGHIGGAITRELCEQGHQVIAPCRNPDPLSDTAAEIYRVKDYDHYDINRLLDGADWLLNAAAPYPMELGTSADTFRAAERSLCRHLTAARSLGVKVLYVSSFVTLLDRQRRHPYYVLKTRLEQLVLAERRAGLTSIIVNPPACFGPYDNKATDQALLPAMAAGRLPAILSGELQWIDVRDLALDLVAAMANEQAVGPATIRAQTTSTEELAATVERLTGTPPPALLRTAPALTRIGATLGEVACQVAGLGTPLPVLTVLLLLDANAPLRGEVLPAATRRCDLETSLRDALDWYQRSQ